MTPARAHAIMDAASQALAIDENLRALLDSEGISQERLKTDIAPPLMQAFLQAQRDAEDSHGS